MQAVEKESSAPTSTTTTAPTAVTIVRAEEDSSEEPDVFGVPINTLVPAAYRQSHPLYVFTDTVVTVQYSHAGGEWISTASTAPAATLHRTEEAAAAAGYAGVGTVSPSSFIAHTGVSNAKEDLLEMLLAPGMGEQADGGRALPVPSQLEEVHTRLKGERCDATYITSLPLLVRLVSLIFASRANPARSGVGCVRALNLSHTSLGTVGAHGPPMVLDSAEKPYAAVQVPRFFPDESLPRSRTSARVKARVAKRSLALCFVAPLLFMPDLLHYAITELVCTHSDLGDEDAHGLAFILSKPNSKTHLCKLETIDLSFNSITDKGAVYLRNAIRTNRQVTTLNLASNSGITNTRKILESIEKQLFKNRERKKKQTVKSSKAPSHRPFPWRLLGK